MSWVVCMEHRRLQQSCIELPADRRILIISSAVGLRDRFSRVHRRRDNGIASLGTGDVKHLGKETTRKMSRDGQANGSGWDGEETSVETSSNRFYGKKRETNVISNAVASLGTLLKGHRTRHSLRPSLCSLRPLSGPLIPSLPSSSPESLVSFPDDNFLSAARLTYFLPDNGLKFHAIVVTIRRKKLIELDSPEEAAG